MTICIISQANRVPKSSKSVTVHSSEGILSHSQEAAQEKAISYLRRSVTILSRGALRTMFMSRQVDNEVDGPYIATPQVI